MTNVLMALDMFVKSLAQTLGIDGLTETELATICETVNGLFGMAINAVSMSTVSRVQRRLPLDAHSRAVLRGLTINGCLRKNDSFSKVLRALISETTRLSGDERADDVGCLLYWTTQGIDDNPQFQATVSHL